MATSSRVYKNALELIRLYNSSPSFRVKFQSLIESKPNTYYKGVKLKDYVKTLTQTSPKYTIYRFYKIGPETINSLFTNFYLDTFSRNRLEKSAADHYLTDEDYQQNQETESIGKLSEGKEKEDAWSHFLDKHSTEKSELKPTIEKQNLEPGIGKERTFNNAVDTIAKKYDTVKNSQLLKAANSKGQILTRRLINKVDLSGGISVFGGALGSMLNFGGERVVVGSMRGLSIGSRALNGIQIGKSTLPIGLMRSPLFWVGVTFLAIVLVLMPGAGGLSQSAALLPPYVTPPATATTTPAPSEVELTKSGPTLVHSETDLPYQLTVTYKGSTKKTITVTDTLPNEVDFKSASDGGLNKSGIVEWKIDMDPGTTKTLDLVTFVKKLPPGVPEITILNVKFGASYNSPRTTTAAGGSLNYSIPFRDISITITDPTAIKSFILSSWPSAQISNFEHIKEQAIAHGFNPAFLIALWIEESGAQGKAGYTDPLGCDPKHPTTDIDVSLKCVFDAFTSYTNFADFMCKYSESTLAPCTFNTNPNFPGNIKDVYSKIVPSGSGSITIP